MNQIEITFGGKQYSLLFNGYAMFAEQEMFGEKGMIEEIQQNTAEGFEALCKAVCLLAEQGELARRYEGHEAQEMLSADQVRVLATPIDMLMLRTAVVKAVLKGYGREVEEAEKDLGLAELEKKNNQRLTKANYLQIGTLNKLSVKETMILPPGMVFDLFELYLRAHGKGAEPEY